MTAVSETTVDLSQGAGRWLSDENVQERISSALAGWMQPNEFGAQMVIAFQKQVEEDYKPIGTIAKVCSPKSQFEAAMFCASVQLVPTLSQVALIPRKVKGNIWECHTMVQWQGFQSLMTRHPDIRDISARVVFDGDEFEFDGTSNRVTKHQYDPFDVNREVKPELANVRGGYLEIEFMDGRVKNHMVSIKSILKARGCAKTQKIWNSWPLEQTLKTIYRNGYARRIVPIDPLVEKRVAKVIDLEDSILENDPMRVVDATATSSARLIPSVKSKPVPSLEPETIEPEQPAKAPDAPLPELAIVDAALAAIEAAESSEAIADIVGGAEQELSGLKLNAKQKKGLFGSINDAAKARSEKLT